MKFNIYVSIIIILFFSSYPSFVYGAGALRGTVIAINDPAEELGMEYVQKKLNLKNAIHTMEIIISMLSAYTNKVSAPIRIYTDLSESEFPGRIFPSKKNIMDEYLDLGEIPQADDDIFFLYITGHGFSPRIGEDPILLLPKGESDDQSLRLNLWHVFEPLLKMRGIKIIIIDSCRTVKKGLTDSKTTIGLNYDTIKQQLLGAQNMYVIYSSTSGKPSYIDPNSDFGLFTNYLYEAISNPISTDTVPPFGLITFNELMIEINKNLGLDKYLVANDLKQESVLSQYSNNEFFSFNPALIKPRKVFFHSFVNEALQHSQNSVLKGRAQKINEELEETGFVKQFDRFFKEELLNMVATKPTNGRPIGPLDLEKWERRVEEEIFSHSASTLVTGTSLVTKENCHRKSGNSMNASTSNSDFAILFVLSQLKPGSNPEQFQTEPTLILCWFFYYLKGSESGLIYAGSNTYGENKFEPQDFIKMVQEKFVEVDRGAREKFLLAACFTPSNFTKEDLVAAYRDFFSNTKHIPELELYRNFHRILTKQIRREVYSSEIIDLGSIDYFDICPGWNHSKDTTNNQIEKNKRIENQSNALISRLSKNNPNLCPSSIVLLYGEFDLKPDIWAITPHIRFQTGEDRILGPLTHPNKFSFKQNVDLVGFYTAQEVKNAWDNLVKNEKLIRICN